LRILFLTSRFPFPPIGGDKLRVYHFLKHLSQRHEIDLFSLMARPDESAVTSGYGERIKKTRTVLIPRAFSYINCFVGIFTGGPLQNHYFKSKRARKVLESLLVERGYNLLFVHLIRMADYVKHIENIPKVIDLTDALSLNYERARPYQKGIFSLINIVEQKRVLQYESEVMKHFDRGFLISKYDRDFMSSYTDVSKIYVIPNGVDCSFFDFRTEEHIANSIVFLGNLRTFPNTDAAVHFVHNILPSIKDKVPGVKFTIVGLEPSRRVRKLIGSSDITIANAVPDVRPYLARSTVSVCPLRAGAGVQNKILESMALGTPVVTTSIGLQGIDAVPERDLLVADDPRRFAENVIRLIRNKAFRNRLARNGRKLIQERYSWEKSLSPLDEVIESVGLQ